MSEWWRSTGEIVGRISTPLRAILVAYDSTFLLPGAGLSSRRAKFWCPRLDLVVYLISEPSVSVMTRSFDLFLRCGDRHAVFDWHWWPPLSGSVGCSRISSRIHITSCFEYSCRISRNMRIKSLRSKEMKPWFFRLELGCIATNGGIFGYWSMESPSKARCSLLVRMDPGLSVALTPFGMVGLDRKLNRTG